MDKGRKGSAGLIILIVIIVAVIAAGFLFYYLRRPSTNPPATAVGSVASSSSLAGWNTYSDSNAHFTIQYPQDWYISTSSDGGASTTYDIAPIPPLPPGEVDMRKGFPYVYIELGTCEDFYATFPGSATSTVTVNGIPMEKIETNMLNNTSSPQDSGRFVLYTFPGNSSYGWDSQCNTIRLYVSGIDSSGIETSTQEIANIESLEDQILGSFSFD